MKYEQQKELINASIAGTEQTTELLKDCKYAIDKRHAEKPVSKVIGLSRYCPDCGHLVEPVTLTTGNKFCSWCGKAIDWSR